MKYVTIYADASGDPGLNNISAKSYFVWGCVAVRDTSAFRFEIKDLLKEVHNSGAYPVKLSELKFNPPHKYWKDPNHKRGMDAYYTDMDSIRKKALGIIADRADGVSAMIVNKRDVQSGWDARKLQKCALYQHFCFGILPSLAMSAPPQMVYDQGIPAGDKTSLHNMVRSQASKYERQGSVSYKDRILMYDADSEREVNLGAADMVAGAFRRKYVDCDSTYADMVSAKMICEDIFDAQSPGQW